MFTILSYVFRNLSYVFRILSCVLILLSNQSAFTCREHTKKKDTPHKRNAPL